MFLDALGPWESTLLLQACLLFLAESLLLLEAELLLLAKASWMIIPLHHPIYKIL